jgi:DNA-binding transcriptional LysR family regulator
MRTTLLQRTTRQLSLTESGRVSLERPLRIFSDGVAVEAQTGFDLPEIIQDQVHVGWRGDPAVQVGVDNPAARFDRRIVAEIVRRFENVPGRIRGLVRLRLVESHARAFARDGTE